MFRKIFISIALTASIANSAYAGPEDWEGTFYLKAVDQKEYAIRHTSTSVRFMFFNVGQCLFLGKGSSINGLVMPEDVNLCTKQNLDDFAKELGKFSTILSSSIKLGPTYSKS